MFTFYKNSQKGQDLVEYALMLAIIIGIGWGIYSQTGVADSIKNVFGNASSLMETAKKNTRTFDMEAVLKRIKEKQTGYLGNGHGYDMDYRRGMIQSGWLTNGDETDSTIGKLASELGATMWTFYNGENTGKLGQDGGGLYWTTENLDSETSLKKEGIGWSKQTVLSYYYDPKDKTYSVIENRVWLNQSGADGQTNHKGLAQLPVEHRKPEGKVLGTYQTYEAAQQRYNEVKKAQGGYIYIGTAQTE